MKEEEGRGKGKSKLKWESLEGKKNYINYLKEEKKRRKILYNQGKLGEEGEHLFCKMPSVF
jgi:hypothetical protein